MKSFYSLEWLVVIFACMLYLILLLVIYFYDTCLPTPSAFVLNILKIFLLTVFWKKYQLQIRIQSWNQYQILKKKKKKELSQLQKQLQLQV